MATRDLPVTPLPFIWFFFKRYKLSFFAFLVLQLGTGLWSPLNSLLVKWLINTLSEQGSAGQYQTILWPCSLILLNFIIFDNVVYRCADLFNYYHQSMIKNEITRTVLAELLSQPHDFFHQNLSGALARQVTTLTESIEIIAHKVGPQFIRGFALVIAALITSYTASPLFSLLIGLWFISFTVMSMLMSHRLVLLADRLAFRESEISGQLVDILSNQYNVRIFAAQSCELKRLSSFFSLFQQAFQGRMRYVILLLSLQGACITIFIAATLGTLLYLHAQRSITIGDFSMILGLAISLAHTLWYIMWDFGYFNEAYGRCQQSLKALLHCSQPLIEQEKKQLPVCHGQIDFQNVCFSYSDGSQIFDKLSVHIRPLEKVGLVGSSGGGKSTFINLLLGLYQPTSGSILIDGTPLSEIADTSLHQTISLVPQDPSLFDRTLQDNIAYGHLDATLEQVIAAAKKADAHDFIMQLSAGYQTVVGERGSKISGGQRQRIAIARSILKNAPIVIFDEATSQLDSLTEHGIEKNLHQFLKDKTALIVAHRLSTLVSMDRILVFDKGAIIEDGTHEELLAQGGLYARLWAQQNPAAVTRSLTNEVFEPAD